MNCQQGVFESRVRSLEAEVQPSDLIDAVREQADRLPVTHRQMVEGLRVVGQQLAGEGQ